MKTKTRLIPHWLPLAALAIGWLPLTTSLVAQTAARGSIQGHVYNPASNEYVQNAEVRLGGSLQVTYTEADGSFKFDNVPVGTASISVAFSGYITAKETFNVTAGLPAVRYINHTSTIAGIAGENKHGVVTLNTFTVSTAREGNSKAIMAQRRDMNIVTSVSSDIFGDITDGNVGEFLKYLPGVDLDYVQAEARSPRLGGMDAQYVGVATDGVRIANADANRGGGSNSRATSFEGFSITSIDSIEINRTASPENDADSPAGSINMKTKRAFERKGRTFNYAYGISFNDEEFTLKKTPGFQDGRANAMSYKWAPNWQATYSESFFQQKFGLVLSASHSTEYTEQSSETVDYNRGAATDPRPLVVRNISINDGPKVLTKEALLLTADWKITPRLVLSLNASYSLYDAPFWDRSFDFTAANSNANVNNGRDTVGGDGVLAVIAPRDLTAAVGLLPNGTVRNNGVASLTNGGTSGAKTVHTRQYVQRFEYKLGAWTIEGSLAASFANNNYDALERGFAVSEGGTIASGWTATRPNKQSWEWTIRQNTGTDWFDLRSFTNNTDTRTGGTRVANDDRNWNTEKWTGVLNLSWAVPRLERFPTVMKFGGKWDEETRKNRTDSDLEVWSYNGPGGNTTAVNPTTGANFVTSFGNWANVGPQFISPFPWDVGTSNKAQVYNIAGVHGVPPRVSRTEIANLFNAHPEQFVNTSTPENYYTANYVNARHFVQTIKAGYWQSDTRLTSKLQIRFGVRAEQTENALLEFDPLTRAQLLAKGVALNAVTVSGGRPLTISGMRTMFETNPMKTRRSDYTDWFPSFLAKYQFSPNLEFQAGVNKAISRPPIDNLTGLWVQNDGVTPPTVTAPNPNLQPEHHKVYQARLAYYFGGKSPGQVSLAYIQDEATNFIESRTYSAAQFGITDPTYAGYDFISSANTVGLQRYKNFDFNYNQTLGFLPGEYLRGITIGATYSRSYANQRRNNLAPQRGTARLGYSYKRFSTAIGAVWSADKPIDGVYGRVLGAMTNYDISASYKLNRYATVYLQARNPTNQKFLRYESPPGVQEGNERHLRGEANFGANWVFGVKGDF